MQIRSVDKIGDIDDGADAVVRETLEMVDEILRVNISFDIDAAGTF